MIRRASFCLWKLQICNIDKIEGKIIVSPKEVSGFNMGRETKSRNISKFRKIAAKGLEAINPFRVSIAPTLKTDLCWLTLWCHGDVNVLRDPIMMNGNLRSVFVHCLPNNILPRQKRSRGPENGFCYIAAEC